VKVKQSVFLSYARENQSKAKRLSEDLENHGVRVWRDKAKLLGGENFDREIRKAIRSNFHFIMLLSYQSVHKKGYVQKEWRIAMKMQERLPSGEHFLIPVRLDQSRSAHPAVRAQHTIDLFPEWDEGICSIVRSLKEHCRITKRGLPLPENTDWLGGHGLRVASETDLQEIVGLARIGYPCPINDFEKKFPWWKKNQKCFHVILNHAGEIVGNINLLPLKPKAYEQLKNGTIIESELTEKDIYSSKERSRVSVLYIEGLLVHSKISERAKSAALVYMFTKLDRTVSAIGNPRNIRKVCALGGSDPGEKLLKKLQFVVTSEANTRKDLLDFWEADGTRISRSLLNRGYSYFPDLTSQ
jgi:hypothetical protein